MATLILSVALVATVAMYGSELRALAQAREVSVAIELAEDRLATIELLALSRLPNLPDSLEDGRFSAPFESYRWSAEAEAIPGRQLARVAVEVRGPNASHRIATILPLPALRRVDR